MFYNRFQEKKTFYVFNEFIDQFPANFRLRKDFTYFSQLFRRSLSELDSTGLVHPQHWAATFLLQKSYLVANAQWKTLRKSICLLQNSPRYATGKVTETSAVCSNKSQSFWGAAQHWEQCGAQPTHKGSLQSTIYWHWDTFFSCRSCHAWVGLCFK